MNAPSAASGEFGGRIDARSITAARDVIIVNNTTVAEYHTTKRTTWRELASFAYPAADVERTVISVYGPTLLFALHRAFHATGFTEFTSQVSVREEIIGSDMVPMIILTSHQIRFVGIVHTTMFKIANDKT